MRLILFFGVLGLSISAHSAKRALVYLGPGACEDGCYDAAFQVAAQAGFDPVYVRENQLDVNSTDAEREALFRDAAVWIQPGGKSRTAMSVITSKLKSAIDAFVRGGGGYVGFCAGAFSATSRVGTSRDPGFGFMPGKTILYRNVSRGAEIIPIAWNGKTRHIYWEGGPHLTRLPEGKAEVVARYPNGQVAAAKSIYGQGRIFVTGLHPEAPQDWREHYEMRDPDGLDQDLAVEMLNWVTSSP
ncbi:MAG: hypothetical protein KGP28_09840 [Bdellovibrionales bacterium]|nr:hypothetical protein [Bdellovibrionales bacterium]